MPADDRDGHRPMTRLREVRLERGLSQKELAELTGIPLRSLERLDRGELDDAPFRWLINLRIALDCPPADIIEPDWLHWKDDINPRRRTPRPDTLPFRENRSGYLRALPAQRRDRSDG